MGFDSIIIELSLIFIGSALLASLFMYLKQPIIIAYIVLGVIVGPYGLKLITDASHIENLSHLGIVFLLFIIGLNLSPKKMIHLFRKNSIITITTCAIFAIIISLVAYLFGFGLKDSLFIGLALMFSSTVVGLKLIPTTSLHYEYIGEVMISILLLQDILAIILIVFINKTSNNNLNLLFMFLKTIIFILFAVFTVKKVVINLLKRFDIIQEYIFVLVMGWCFLGVFVAKFIGLSYEVGGFIAGSTLAMYDVSLVIAEKLKNLREFFLILFFFAIGTQLDFLLLQNKSILIPAIVLTLLIITIKPLVYMYAFKLVKEKKNIYYSLSLRLGQSSEFSLLIAYTALANRTITNNASFLIQMTFILALILSTYIVTLKLPTPIALDESKLQD